MPAEPRVKDRIPLAEPTIGGNAARYLEECLATNFVSSVGPFVERFEATFAAAVGSRYAVACSTGTAAIHLALLALDVGRGDEVWTSTLTFVASANAISYVGAQPVLVDSEDETYNLDPGIVVDELDRRAEAGLPLPAAIEVVHLVGHPADMAPIVEAATRYDVPIVEDASEALGARYVGSAAADLAGRHVGTIGRVGAFSFNGNKIITTGGGGMVVTDDDALARRVRHLSTQARLPGRAYDHDEVGYNYRLSNLAAALGLAQLEQLPDLLAARRRIAARYDEAIEGIPGLRPAPRRPWAEPSFWLYSARLAEPDLVRRDEVLDALLADGIEGRPMWTPLHQTRLLAGAPRLGHEVADRIFAGAISLPSSSSLRPESQERVIESLRAALGGEARAAAVGAAEAAAAAGSRDLASR
jgi:dTDP-4-amino-4,6-dideoxygalactose transaminase